MKRGQSQAVLLIVPYCSGTGAAGTGAAGATGAAAGAPAAGFGAAGAAAGALQPRAVPTSPAPASPTKARRVQRSRDTLAMFAPSIAAIGRPAAGPIRALALAVSGVSGVDAV